MKLIEKLYLGSVLLVFWGFTAAFFAKPRELGEKLGIQLTNVTALADFRAMYGGMCRGVGVLFLLGMTKPEQWRVPAILLSVTTAAGLLLGRILTWALEGNPGTIIHGFMATEVFAIVVGVWLLKKP